MGGSGFPPAKLAKAKNETQIEGLGGNCSPPSGQTNLDGGGERAMSPLRRRVFTALCLFAVHNLEGEQPFP